MCLQIQFVYFIVLREFNVLIKKVSVSHSSLANYHICGVANFNLVLSESTII